MNRFDTHGRQLCLRTAIHFTSVFPMFTLTSLSKSLAKISALSCECWAQFVQHKKNRCRQIFIQSTLFCVLSLFQILFVNGGRIGFVSHRKNTQFQIRNTNCTVNCMLIVWKLERQMYKIILHLMEICLQQHKWHAFHTQKLANIVNCWLIKEKKFVALISLTQNRSALWFKF